MTKLDRNTLMHLQTRNLHRSAAVPDWELISPEDRNVFQNIAAATHGIVTPGNVLTVAGIALIIQGSRNIQKGNVTRGCVEIAAGAWGDYVDGIAAHITGTKSPLGKRLDAGGDKLKSGFLFKAMHKEHVVPDPILAFYFGQNTANGLLTTAQAAMHRPELDVSSKGKQFTGAEMSSIGLFCLSRVARDTDHESSAKRLYEAAIATSLIAIPLGLQATQEYAEVVLLHQDPEKAYHEATFAQTA